MILTKMLTRDQDLSNITAQPQLDAQQVFDQSLAQSARNAIYEGIGNPAQNATGLLNRLAASENMTDRLGQVFGPRAVDYQQGLANEVARVQTARTVDPNFGSQTAVRAADAGGLTAADLVTGAIDLKTGGFTTAIRQAMRFFAEGSGLTHAEREAIARILTGPAEASPAQVQAVRTVVTNAAYRGVEIPDELVTFIDIAAIPQLGRVGSESHPAHWGEY